MSKILWLIEILTDYGYDGTGDELYRCFHCDREDLRENVMLCVEQWKSEHPYVCGIMVVNIAKLHPLLPTHKNSVEWQPGLYDEIEKK